MQKRVRKCAGVDKREEEMAGEGDTGRVKTRDRVQAYERGGK